MATTRFYRTAGGEELGRRFFDAALAAVKRIERMPGSGSLRLGELCHVAGLRDWPVEGFPVRWYYFEHLDHLDVVRLLGDAQDLPAILLSDSP